MEKPKLVIFASGTKDGGGSGFKNLVEASRDGRLEADIVAVVGNIRGGGVEEKAGALSVPFVHFPKEARTPEEHERLVKELAGDDYWVSLSGCLWLVPMKEFSGAREAGLDPRRVFNIHPGPLSVVRHNGTPEFGGAGMHGHFVHEAVMRAFRDTKRAPMLRHSGVSMHFVTKEYDDGPVFFELPVPIPEHFDADMLGRWVNQHEHLFQPEVTNLVVHQRIKWNGRDPKSLIVPMRYKYLPKIRRNPHSDGV